MNTDTEQRVTAPPDRVWQALLAAIPAAPFGLPIVAWIGGLVYLGIFAVIFSSYVF